MPAAALYTVSLVSFEFQTLSTVVPSQQMSNDLLKSTILEACFSFLLSCEM